MTAPTPIEDRLRRALSLEAATVEVDAPVPLAASAAVRRSRPGVLVAALAAVSVLALAVVARDDDGNRLQVTAPPGRLYLAPTDAEDFRLLDADTDADDGLAVTTTHRTLGRPSADGRFVAAAVTIIVHTDDGPVLNIGEMLRVEGEDVAIQRSSDREATLIWSQDSRRTVELRASGLSDVELVALVASLRPGPAESREPNLPGGFVAAPASATPSTDEDASRQLWVGSGPGRAFEIALTEAPALGLDALAWRYPGARPTTVRGQQAMVLEGQRRTLAWLERPGALVAIESEGLPLSRLRSLADGLRVLDEVAWDRLVSTAEQPNVSYHHGWRSTVVVASGEREGRPWEATAHRLLGVRDAVVCLTMEESDTCHQTDRAGMGAISGLWRSRSFLTGGVDLDVARIRIMFADGRRLDVQPVGGEAGFPIAFLVLPLPEEVRSATVTAFDDAGRELGRQDVGPLIPG